MSGDRGEIERIKNEMRRSRRMQELVDNLDVWRESDEGKRAIERSKRLADAMRVLRGSDEDRRIAQDELEAEGWPPPALERRIEVPIRAVPAPRPAPSPKRGVRRGPGRPRWTEETYWGVYREARDAAGGRAATDKEIAAKFGRGKQQLLRLIRRFGRPD